MPFCVLKLFGFDLIFNLWNRITHNLLSEKLKQHYLPSKVIYAFEAPIGELIAKCLSSRKHKLWCLGRSLALLAKDKRQEVPQSSSLDSASWILFR